MKRSSLVELEKPFSSCQRSKPVGSKMQSATSQRTLVPTARSSYRTPRLPSIDAELEVCEFSLTFYDERSVIDILDIRKRDEGTYR